MGVLICPVCGKALEKEERRFCCANGHSFDIAKEGYVNLLTGSKSGDKTGDSRESARARHEFLQKGYFDFLKEEIKTRLSGTVLDICCGEGYYDDYGGELYGFDLSKEMARLAAKRKNGGTYFVANLKAIPIKSESIDTAIHICAPFHAGEFARVLKSGGRLYSVVPAPEHLFELKSLVYDTPYKNDEKYPQADGLALMAKETVTKKAVIPREDLKTLFSMTPYFYRTRQSDKDKIDSVAALKTTLSFVILEYQRA